ncbi:MAG: hypothetical protein Q9M26_01270 [Mariprofundales bacterium]|nr:hypothetical protein [Mariprofundales bacterium]
MAVRTRALAMKAFGHWLLNPWQLTLGADNHPPYKWWRMRPITLFSILAMFALAIQPTPPSQHPTTPPPPPPIPLPAPPSHQLLQMETDAALAQARADALKNTLTLKSDQLNHARRRLSALESILKARKHYGIHLIDSQMSKNSHGQWQIDLTLVRGGNHRAPLHLLLQVFANGHLDQPLAIKVPPNGKMKSTLAIDVMTHAFIHIVMAWPTKLQVHGVLILANDTDGGTLASNTVSPILSLQESSP